VPVGLLARVFRRRDEVAREGARRGLEEALPAPPPPPAAGGHPPPSPADVLRGAGAQVPDLTWVGTPAGGEPVWAFGAPAAALITWWQQLRALHPRTGWWPVLVGPSVEEFDGSWAGGTGTDAAAAVRLARDLRPADVLAALGAGAPEPELGLRLRPQPSRAVVVQAAATPGYVALVRVEQPYDVPAAVCWTGAAGRGVEPAGHSAVLRGWAERFDTEPVAMTADSLELVVARPPRDDDEALAVAREQFAYCPDIVTRGTGRLWDLAGTQVVSSSWYFRWVRQGHAQDPGQPPTP
jgi:Domain of unknown function (DUF4253)